MQCTCVEQARIPFITYRTAPCNATLSMTSEAQLELVAEIFSLYLSLPPSLYLSPSLSLPLSLRLSSSLTLNLSISITQNLNEDSVLLSLVLIQSSHPQCISLLTLFNRTNLALVQLFFLHTNALFHVCSLFPRV